MILLKFLLGFIIGIIAFVNAAPHPELELLNLTLADIAHPDRNMTAQGYDPSFDYFDYSTVQVWMGKKKVAIGSVTGADLYRKVWQMLDFRCPNNANQDCHGVRSQTFKSRCMVHWPAGIQDCYVDIWAVGASWENDAVRRLLIGAVAGALEAVTNRPILGPTNCYDLLNTKGCNVGDVIRVNLPTTGTSHVRRRNYMHVDLWNSKTGYGNWDCCEGDKLALMDKSIDGLGPEIAHEFAPWRHKEFTRDNRCIINGWQACHK